MQTQVESHKKIVNIIIFSTLISLLVFLIGRDFIDSGYRFNGNNFSDLLFFTWAVCMDSGIFLFLTVAGILFSFIVFSLLPIFNFWCRDCFGYGIPILAILYNMYSFFTCHGIFCELWNGPIILVSVVALISYIFSDYKEKRRM